MEELITRVLSGEATRQERARLEEWRRESATNERTYQEFVQTWKLADASNTLGVVPSPPSVERIVTLADRRRAHAVPLRSGSQHRSHFWRWALPVAAAALLVLTVAVSLADGWRAPASTYSTGPTETRTITLADGTIVRLAPNTRLDVRGAEQRSTRLAGRAFFAVAPDSSHPFTVRTGAGEAEVLGTRFDMAVTDDALRLVVVEGRVGLSAAGERVHVNRGEVSSVVGRAAPTAPTTADLLRLLDWPGGVLLFQSTPLSQVAAEVEAHFGIGVAILDSTLARRSVTAWFEDEPFEEVINTICQVVGARCTLGDSVEVRP